MLNIVTIPDRVEILCEGENSDAVVSFEKKGTQLDVFITARDSLPKFIILRWEQRTDCEVRILGDAWERTYKELKWRGFDCTRYMPWYFLASNGITTVGCGVKTGCNSFVSFLYDAGGVTCYIDVRSGSYGVQLKGRELCAASIVCEKYEETSAFHALQSFCRTMCDKPLAPKVPVYGGNNWYYAYGKSSREEMLSDTRLQAKIADGLSNRPYMVIDDGWQKIPCSGPWESNEKYGDMKSLADEMKAIGVKPGIWVRFLTDADPKIPNSWRFLGEKDAHLDPSVPQVLQYISDTVKKLCNMGYELIKHDFSTFDIFEDWGKDLEGTITKSDSLRFYDSTKTSAEIVLGLYKTIREAAGDAVVIGCNTVSHLCAGLVELNRIGDDTSGKSWDRTVRFGVNTLAFRLAQHKTFYDVDADCVGILKDNIPWELNSQWLDLLTKSGTPLFVSCPESEATPERFADLKKAYAIASKQQTAIEPLDWFYNDLPRKWKYNDSELYYDWTLNYTPVL